MLRILILTYNIKFWLKFTGKDAKITHKTANVCTETGTVKFILIRNNSVVFPHTFTFLYYNKICNCKFAYITQ
jgi:hypothetical protein